MTNTLLKTGAKVKGGGAYILSRSLSAAFRKSILSLEEGVAQFLYVSHREEGL